MKRIINGTLYDTAATTVIITRNVIHNGTYAGTDSVRRTKNGALIYVQSSNGQDMYRDNTIDAITVAQVQNYIENWDPTDEEAEALLALKAISNG